ncbi:MAG: caspase family protein [Actinobacteria bacterium]|nr:caspase family protein [Actinomycetota bacterium]
MSGKKRFATVLLAMVLGGLLCAMGAAAAPAEEVKAACGTKGWYFAEGYTGGDFDTWILIQNPNQSDAIAHCRFFTPDGEPITWDVPLQGETRTTVFLNTIPGLEKKEVAAEVTCEGDGVIAERAMYFSYDSGQGKRAGGHATIGADRPSWSWYLPEGYTGGGFDTYVLLMNPGEEDAENVRVKLMKPNGGQRYEFKTSVPAGRRRTIKLDDLVWTEGQDNFIPATGEGGGEQPQQVKFDDTDVSTYICSDKPLVAERAMYFDYYGKAGGSSSIGATETSPEWYLPEGYTGGDFDTWVMAMNPSDYAVDITYTFYSNAPGFQPVSVTHPGVAPWARDTIHVDEVPGLEGTDVSTKVTATRPVQLASAGEEGDVQRYAVLFGIEDYPDGADLKYSVDDMYDIKHKLADSGGFTYIYYEGANATLANFQDKMEWLAENTDEDDIVVLFFGGRSSEDASGDYLDLYDGKVSGGELETYLSNLKTQKLVGLFSCDNSGEIAEGLAAPGRVLLSSCDKGEKSYEYPDDDFTAADGDYGNGVWAYYFVEALGKKEADTNDNGLVSAEEAHGYLDGRVTEFVQDTSSDTQTPRIFDGVAGDLDLTVEKVPAGIVAERSVYFNYGTANDGATSIGACETLPKWFLAEGYTGGGFDTFVLIMNPYDFWQKIELTYMTPTGEPIVEERECPPNYRMTVKVDDVPGLEATDVSTRVEACPMEAAGVGAACSYGVVVERAMYFVYTDPQDGSRKTGGTCSIGYGPR